MRHHLTPKVFEKRTSYKQEVVSWGLTSVSELEDVAKPGYERNFGLYCVKDFLKNIIALEQVKSLILKKIQKNMVNEDEKKLWKHKTIFFLWATFFYQKPICPAWYKKKENKLKNVPDWVKIEKKKESTL